MLNSLLLLMIAITLFCILAPIGILFLFVHCIIFFKLTYAIKYLAKIIIKIAVSIDQLWCVVCSDLFNVIMIKDNWYKFGDPDDTVSECLWLNQESGTLKTTGKILVAMLDFIEKNHCIKSIEKPWN